MIKQIPALLLVLVLWGSMSGCTPPGPRALLRGKKLLDQGKYEAAVEELKTATTLLATNAQAWNYLGLASHRAGQPALALDAYQHALKLNHDLIIVHYNLGCLLLEQNRPDSLEAARNELTAYTLHQPAIIDGWLKLGSAQLRLGEWAAADGSFKEALHLNSQNPEALNDLGMVQLQRKHLREASAFFYSALRMQADYAPAILNLAIVQVGLNNRLLALQKYQEYLAIKPHPANWDSVNAAMQQLYSELNPAPHQTASPPPTNAISASNAPIKSVATLSNILRPDPLPPRIAATNSPKPPTADNRRPPEIVQLTPSPIIRSAKELDANSNSTDVSAREDKKNIFQKLNPLSLFHRQPRATASEATPPPLLTPHEVTVEPAAVSTDAGTVSKTAPVTVPRAPVVIARYAYLSPTPPAAGNRSESQQALNKAMEVQKNSSPADALAAYRNAVQLDPSYFEAQASLGNAALAAGQYSLALRSYETALAIVPDSFYGRFNFALALKKAGYIRDAAQELERLLGNNAAGQSASHLATVHLALGNLYSEQFHQNAQARAHYLKVLELDPQNSQATAIRYWLQDNS